MSKTSPSHRLPSRPWSLAPRARDRQTQVHILSLEGPDPYARAGGIASRIIGLAQALAENGFETHLWFVGDPDLPGHEMRQQLWLHRWCQWISRHHPAGVYDGEDTKQSDYASSLPPFLLREVLLPHLQRGGQAVVLAEEWRTVDAVLHLDWLLRQARVRAQVSMLWNANNTFSFDRIHWGSPDGGGHHYHGEPLYETLDARSGRARSGYPQWDLGR